MPRHPRLNPRRRPDASQIGSSSVLLRTPVSELRDNLHILAPPIWFTARTSHPDGRTVVLHLEGDLDLVSLDRFEEAWRAALADGPRSLVLDLEALRFIDSTGLRGLLSFHEAAAGRLVLRAPGTAVLRVLELTGLDQVLTIEATPADG
jgi:anti-sigma B factor antagonist